MSQGGEQDGGGPRRRTATLTGQRIGDLSPRFLTPGPMPAIDPSVRYVDPNAARGARNIVVHCLRVTAGERVHLLTMRDSGPYGLLARAVEEAGATVVRADLAPLEYESGAVGDQMARLLSLLEGATTTVLISPQQPPQNLALAVRRAAVLLGSRHVELVQIDDRLLGQSVRADPELLQIVNARVLATLAPPCVVSVRSDAGTDLEIRLALTHPLHSSTGRPDGQRVERLPAGHVHGMPARVSGTLVVDRAAFAPEYDIDRGAIRRSPLRLTFAGGRVASVSCTDPTIKSTFERYLGSHPDAERVGRLLVPTNYLVRSEIGVDRQDMLLPGVAVSLGTPPGDGPDSASVAAEMILLGRRQTVEAGGKKLVDAGRFDRDLVDGIDSSRFDSSR